MCGHICRCYSVAAQFEECREKIIELPNIIRDLCHILYYGKVRSLHPFLHFINLDIKKHSLSWAHLFSLILLSDCLIIYNIFIH